MNSAHEATAGIDLGVSPLECRGVSSFLAQQTAIRPNHPAIIYRGRSLTYQELSLRVRAVALELLDCGIRKGDRVGLLFLNHPDYVVAFNSITAIGATVVPINPLLRHEEIAHVLHDSNAKALIVYEQGLTEVSKALPALKGLSNVLVIRNRDNAEVVLDADAVPTTVSLQFLNSDELTELGRQPRQKQFRWSSDIDPLKDLAVLVYTSGTTGKPKGAMLTHDNLLSTVDMSHNLIQITNDDKFLVVIPMCHIYGLSVVMLGLLTKGGTLVILDKFEPAIALKAIEDYAITGLPAVPAMYQFMLMELEKNQYDLSSLRVCLSGASAMPVELFARLEKRLAVPVLEGYGLTETSSVVSINPINGKIKTGSVGLPIPPVEVAIVDSTGKRMPQGPEFIGEITVKGPNVMKGYFGKPEATQECLTEGWFSTGDLGYLDSDGYLFIIGRSKELIIRGGQNIYPREVEDVIMRMPQVAEVAVIGVPDQFMGERVKAVVVKRPDAELLEDDVKLFCNEHLAEFKVPRIVEFSPGLPRNSTGKVLKRLLLPEQ